MMSTWLPLTAKGANSCPARDFGTAALVDLSWLLSQLKQRLPSLRAFVRWKTFVDAPGPSLFVWEAHRPESKDAQLATPLACFERATQQDEPEPMHDVLSVVGALLLRTGLTDDIEVLRTPCIHVGRPTPSEVERAEDRRRRDDEFICFLVRSAFKRWYLQHGMPEHAKIWDERLREPAVGSATDVRRRRPRSRSRS
jgi:hypothetical protein